MRQEVELAGIIGQFGAAFIEQRHPNAFIQKTLRTINQCRTAVMGSHTDVCTSCGALETSYNSCRNRHCPKCQGSKQTKWVDDRMDQLLPVKHYHIVFTVPHQLNEVCLLDSRWFYSALFESVGETLASFGYSRFGMETGAIAVLHTWGQNLSLHPHVHCIVPAAALSCSGQLRPITKDGKYLYPVVNLSRVFRAKMLQRVEGKLFEKTETKQCMGIVHLLRKQAWVVYCKAPFGGPEQIVKYLSRYVHRVAISNNRLVSIDEQNVTFRYKDYSDGEKRKTMTVSGVEFLRRFCLHILPHRFVKIRYFGLLNSRNRVILEQQRRILSARQGKAPQRETIEQIVERITGVRPQQCPHCKKNTMITFDVSLPRNRSPGDRNFNQWPKS